MCYLLLYGKISSRVSNKEVSFSVIRNYVESNSTYYTLKSMTGLMTA